MVMWNKFNRIHFVGIGGTGMSGLAEVLFNMGFKLTGSDLRKSEATHRLENLGIKISYSHNPENVHGSELVVISSAIPEDNPEVLEAKKLRIPVIKRSQMLAELSRMKFCIAISGSHGKTTTTSMIAKILQDSKEDPTVVVGGIIKSLGTGGKLGTGRYLVMEADESDGTFLSLFPTIAVITNIDREHLNSFDGSFKKLRSAFLDFANSVPFYGSVVINAGDRVLQEMVGQIERKVITYSTSGEADLRATKIETSGLRSRFELSLFNREKLTVELPLPGVHNVENALAAFGACIEMGIPISSMVESLSKFSGVRRRFEIKGEAKGITFVDDYAHHPTEIKAVLEVAKSLKRRRIVVLFQPHRYTRTYYLWKRFGEVLSGADLVVLMPIYPAGEKPIEGISSRLVLKACHDAGLRDVQLIEDREELINYLGGVLKEGDLFITIGAGDVWKLGKELLQRLRGG